MWWRVGDSMIRTYAKLMGDPEETAVDELILSTQRYLKVGRVCDLLVIIGNAVIDVEEGHPKEVGK